MAIDLVAKLREARRSRVEVRPGKWVSFLRPAETEMGPIIQRRALEFDDVYRYVCGWDGFTEADLLGPELGVQDPVPFSSDVFAEYARDNIYLVSAVGNAIADSVVAFLKKRADVEKN